MITLFDESRQEEKFRQNFKMRLRHLKYLYGIQDSKNNAHTIDRLLRKVRDRKRLAKEYQQITKSLDSIRRFEKITTAAEETFMQKFKHHWRVQLYPQTWIGNLCVDFFTPAFGVLRKDQIRGYPLKGIGFEIDGTIHDREDKAKKDVHKETALNDLGILLWRLKNYQVHKSENFPRKTNWQDFGTLCSRARARLWSRIHLTTLLYHGTPSLIGSYFNKFQNYEK